MKTKNLRKAIALGISSMVMTGLLTSTVAFAAPVAGQQYTTFTSTGSIAEGIKAGNATITINNNGYNSHAEYTAYKVLDATVSGTVYKYTVNSNFSSLFGSTYTVTEGGSIKKGTEEITSNSDLAKEFAQAVEAKANGLTGTKFNVGAEQELAPGYYVIVQTGSNSADAWVPSLPILVDLPQKSGDNYIYATKVDPKGGYPSITKKIVENNTKYDKNDVSINDDVNYEITSDVTKYSSNATNITYKMVDTLSKGLTFNGKENVKIYGIKGSTETPLTLKDVCTVTTTPDPTVEGKATEITFDFIYSNIKEYDKVKVVYSAKLNKDAVIGEGGNPNDVKLVYTNNPNTTSTATPGTTTETETPKVYTYTYGLAVKKVDQNNPNKVLKGAKFAIYSDEACEKEVSGKGNFETQTAETGYQKFAGLDAGTYYIKETSAPSGYVKSDKVLKVVIEGLDKEGNVTTENDKLTGKAKYTISVVGKTGSEISFVVQNDADGNATVTAVNGTSLTGEYNLDKLGLAVVGNVEGVELPKTGGAGTWMFTIGGLVLMAGAVTAVAVSKKKEEN